MFPMVKDAAHLWQVVAPDGNAAVQAGLQTLQSAGVIAQEHLCHWNSI